MRRITVICTRHESHGKCNSDELLRIVKSIKPNVFFVELSSSNFERVYNQNISPTLETITTILYSYSCHHEVSQFPIDTYPRDRFHDEKVNKLYFGIINGPFQEANQYKQILNQQRVLIEEYGFDFLNSPQNDLLFNELDGLKLKILQQLNEEELYEIHHSELEMINNREQAMLRNIYDYAAASPFDEAVMFIGSGHRRTIFPLIDKFDKEEKTKIEWRNYAE